MAHTKSTLQIIQSHMDQLLHGSVRDTLQVGSSLIPITKRETGPDFPIRVSRSPGYVS
ncbi:MAG: hypothetical protein PUF30_10380 [bacterium]|nr:hypothetical protein [bacterium]